MPQTSRLVLPPALLALATSLAIIAVMSAPVSAASSPSGSVVLRDAGGDANGINDQSEGLLGDFVVGHDIPEADLKTLSVSPLRSDRGDTVGFRFAIATTGLPGHIEGSGTPLRYSVIMQLTPDCRMSVDYTAKASRADGAAELSSSCDNEGLLFAKSPLASRVAGHRVLIDVPYDVGPDEMQPGEIVEYTGMLSSAAPLSAYSDGPVYGTQIDNAARYNGWMLPF